VLNSDAYAFGSVFFGAVSKFMFGVEPHTAFRNAVTKYLNNSRGYIISAANVLIVSLADTPTSGRRLSGKGRLLLVSGLNVTYAVLAPSVQEASLISGQLK
jgi:hypothetical protein